MLNKWKINKSQIHQRTELIGQTEAPRIGETDNKYRELALTGAEICMGTSTGVESPKLNLQIAGGSIWARVKI